jgi:hypothetical protein
MGKNSFDDDFGFSLVSEEELKEHENKLKEQVVQSQRTYGNKLDEIRALIMPLLNNLMSNPEKHYIYWPNRTEKIEQFIQRLDDCINR